MDCLAHLGDDVTAPTGASTARVAIIGGGYAGMAAAVSLAARGTCSTIFEAGKFLGGRARRIDYRGETIDNGQHILSGAYSESLRLMAMVGVPEASVSRIPLALSMPPHFSLRAPRLIAPLHLLWALLSAKGLTLADRFAAIRFMRALKAAKFQVGAMDTVASLLAAQRQPDRLIRHLWQPLAISALNTPIATASAQIFANVLRDALAASRDASDLILPRTDLSALFPDLAAAWLAARGSTVNSGTRVKSVRAAGELLEIAADTGETKFDAVIVAIGPHQFDSISLPAECVINVPFSYQPIVTIYLRFDRHVRLPLAMLGQADGMVQWFFDRRQLVQGSAGTLEPLTGDGLIAAVISASGAHETMTHDDLAAQVLLELTRHTGPLPVPLWTKVIMEKFATFACTAPIQRDRPANLTSCPGLVLAGDYTAGEYPATIEGAVRSGISAAEHVSHFLSARRP